MRIIRSLAQMQQLAASWKRGGIRTALVPTMGYLHAGHLSLVARGRKLAGKKGKVVVSIYVNPTQFGPREDFSRYPRDLRRDANLCRKASVDVVFAPSDDEMYPPGSFTTFIVEEQLSRHMEGASRPTHFRGVTTIVAKLFNIVQPAFAVFGAKDFQQAAIIRRMAANLNFPLKVVVAPTFREPDGLAMSSRNKYLTGDLRIQATVLWRTIQLVQDLVRQSTAPVGASGLKAKLKRHIEQEPSARLDYIGFFNPVTLEPAMKVQAGVQMALAVFIGKTRLIDNDLLG